MPLDETVAEDLSQGQTRFQLVTSREFTEWLATEKISLAVTTYQVGAVMLLGLKPGGDLSIFLSRFDRAMGLCLQGNSLWLAAKTAIWRLESVHPEEDKTGQIRLFVPRVGYVTGDVDAHDILIEPDGRPVFVNTRFNCLATVDDHHSFRPIWRPPFLSALCGEDRCHLNGVAEREGRARYVTMVAKSDVADGWRDFRDTGGLVMDVTTNEEIATGLSMPHSPRFYEGRLWLLNAGSGHLGYIDAGSGRFEPVTFVPGYARGLAFHGRFAIVGLSMPRREHAFQGLALDRNLAEKGAVARCGLMVIDLTSGAVAHWARSDTPIEEFYDIAVLPNIVRPMALGFTSPRLANQLDWPEDPPVSAR